MNTTCHQEETVFNAVRNLMHPAQREAFLDQACAGDPKLRERVEALLATEMDSERFFAEGISAISLPTVMTAKSNGHSTSDGQPLEAAPDERLSSMIGRYKLLEKIGEGGCGSVYMAEQQEPVRRRVALKVVKLGMDTKSVIARFEAERQALAMMDHPNIARVLDAGATDTGRPFFVMELVRGVKITDYCDQNHLDTGRRLDLFVQICRAIQHAHQKGIIHRDIKPSNILVTLHDGVPVPKVIDFGIAKATEARLTEKTVFTGYAQFIGTPAYMSPEQAEMSGLDIDTRSDIYSLGVLLYELLTGRTPFDGRQLLESGIDEMRRTLREREPQRPSHMLNTLSGEELHSTAQQRQSEAPKLVSLMRGDLDWIVMKALEKDRTRRYETANGLGMDIQRYMKNEPVVARPPSQFYQFRKLVRRNRVPFVAAAGVAVALIIGLGTSTWLFLKERDARQRAVQAEREQKRLREEAERGLASEIVLRTQVEAREKITQAASLLTQDRFAEADKLINELSVRQPTMEGAGVFRSLGEWHAIQGHWKSAADRFNTLLEVNQLDGWDTATLDLLECGASLIEMGDLDGYDRFREEMVSRFQSTTNPVAAERVVKMAVLLPPDLKLMRSLETLADVTGSPSLPDEPTAWRCLSLSLFEYRQGAYDRAINWAQRAYRSEDNAPRNATTCLIRAMSHQQIHRTAEARTELAEAREAIVTRFR
jgi:serine/threonine protein kinase